MRDEKVETTYHLSRLLAFTVLSRKVRKEGDKGINYERDKLKMKGATHENKKDLNSFRISVGLSY
jgi:hypothetical protein